MVSAGDGSRWRVRMLSTTSRLMVPLASASAQAASTASSPSVVPQGSHSSRLLRWIEFRTEAGCASLAICCRYSTLYDAIGKSYWTKCALKHYK